MAQADTQPAPPTAPPTKPLPVGDEVAGELQEELQEEYIGPSGWRQWLRGLGACTMSMVVHLVLLIALSLWMMPGNITERLHTILAPPVEPREELQQIELEPELRPATEMTAVVNSAPQFGAEAALGGMTGSGDSTSLLDAKVVKQHASSDHSMTIDHPLLGAPTAKKLIEEVPDGFKGEPRMIIDNYQQAFDVITQEIMWMLERSDVLVIWCFDQSESMKDDQEEIRSRVEKVYHELGLTRRVSDSDHLLTAVTSYGDSPRFLVHTPKPSSDFDVIRAAISNVPQDPSGKEMMCEAVTRSIATFRDHARRRQVALILVTDESGEQENNYKFLEAAIAQAKAARCKVYTLGREAVFGYPFAHMRWVHPQTERPHWLRINRGPETGFVEQLQTDGFRRRYDGFGSGFGPYEQARLSRETGGIFFMLPSLETNLVRGHKRHYELEILRPYKPDLRSRMEVVADRDRYPLRTFLWKVISDLNPHNEAAARVVEMRMAFSLNQAEFLQQARREQQKATLFIRYLGEVERILEDDALPHRQQEPEPRWQGNYDLIRAQVVAYQARLYEYGARLEAFIQEPQTAPLTREPNLKLVHWDVGTHQPLLAPDVSQPYIDRATELLEAVIENHPETPWAERAKWELGRGFGVRLVPDYDPPYVDYPNPIPVPTL